MATTALKPEIIEQEVLVNYLISMARTVEGTVNRSLDALIGLGDPRTIAAQRDFCARAAHQRNGNDY